VIQRSCRERGLPDLSALVVARETLQLGKTFFTPYGLQEAGAGLQAAGLGQVRATVYAHDWGGQPFA